jgi:hypothetical protein
MVHATVPHRAGLDLAAQAASTVLIRLVAVLQTVSTVRYLARATRTNATLAILALLARGSVWTQRVAVSTAVDIRFRAVAHPVVASRSLAHVAGTNRRLAVARQQTLLPLVAGLAPSSSAVLVRLIFVSVATVAVQFLAEPGIAAVATLTIRRLSAPVSILARRAHAAAAIDVSLSHVLLPVIAR